MPTGPPAVRGAAGGARADGAEGGADLREAGVRGEGGGVRDRAVNVQNVGRMNARIVKI